MTNVRVKWINVTTVTVSWMQIVDSPADEEILIYLVTYNNTKLGTSKTKNVSFTSSTTSITGLDSAQGYVFSVAVAVLVNGSIVHGPAAQPEPVSSQSPEMILFIIIGVIAVVFAVFLLPAVITVCYLIA